MFDNLRRWLRRPYTSGHSRYSPMIEVAARMLDDLPPADRAEIQALVYYKAARRRGVEPTPLHLFSRLNRLGEADRDTARRWIVAFGERTLRAQGYRPPPGDEAGLRQGQHKWGTWYERLSARDRAEITQQIRTIREVTHEQGESAGQVLTMLFMFQHDRRALVQISRLLDDLACAPPPHEPE